MSSQDSSPHRASTMTLREAITSRHSAREFLPDPVPPDIISRALTLASSAPSNSNVQPWRLWILSGEPLVNLKAELVKHASSDEEPQIPPLPPWASHFRSEAGETIYGVGWGIPREDLESRKKAVLRNFEFFGAPMGVIVCMKDDLGRADSLSVGMYLQTLVLALKAEGVDCCVEVSISGYPEVVKKTVGVPDDMAVLCGVAIGFEKDHQVNHLTLNKFSFEETTVILPG